MMQDAPRITTSAPPGDRLRSLLSLVGLILALALLAATYFLMSPPSDAGYPGARPWSEAPLLKRVTDWMSWGGAVRTIRGVEIKDFAFHLAAGVALVLLAVRALISGLWPPERRTMKGVWFAGQAFLAAWVLLSLASAWWSGEPGLSLGQGALYALSLSWAMSLAWCLESRDVPRLLWGYVIIAALGAVLCIWYYYGRNPFHRPGFPIGNPSTLAGCTLPAILIAGAVLIGKTWTRVRERGAMSWHYAIAAIVALIPLVWCFWLAGSRGTMVGAVVGVAGVFFLRARRRVRWLIVIGLVLVAGVGAWRLSADKQDFAMARGATIRFRMYAWQYAAQLWSQRPISGTGAGQYPRLAGGLSVGDRVLDPAAFMAEMVEHAHNELFEVFAEIGLVGGVTFVAGYVATLIAAALLLRANLSRERRWLVYGLVAGVVALMADGLFGVGLRLSGVPVVHYTLLAALWALCRSISKVPASEREITDEWRRRMLLRRYGLAAASLVAAIAAGWMTMRDWRGVRHEMVADDAFRAGQYQDALAETRAAETLLLDSVRRLIADKRAVDCEFALAGAAYGRAVAVLENGPAASANSPDVEHAIGQCETATDAALSLSRRATNFGRMAATGAQCSEMLANLYALSGDEQAAGEWSQMALRAWQSQHALRPFDFQTLLKLTAYFQRYDTLTGEYIGLLRDALRNGFPPAEWYAALRNGPRMREFERTLAALVQSVGPYAPETDLDALILSRAPEMYRLSAAWLAMQGAYEPAAANADRAAGLYAAMRTRFPELYSVARAEQAEYAFLANPDDPAPATALLQDAIGALPVIQQQKYDAMARPYRMKLARLLLVGEKENAARAVLLKAFDDDEVVTNAMADMYADLARSFIRRPADQRPPVERWISAALRLRPAHQQAWAWRVVLATEGGDASAVRATLQAAKDAGLPETDLAALRRIVEQQMPGLFEQEKEVAPAAP